jgi:hypothetical protein
MRKTCALYALVLLLITGINHAHAENASNPLASVSNTDLRWQHFDLGGSDRNDFYADGSYMLTPKLKLKYELHYWDTDVTGSNENDWETLHLKPIWRSVLSGLWISAMKIKASAWDETRLLRCWGSHL